MEAIWGKFERLREIIFHTGGAVLAFSGGVDSTFLACVAREVLGDRLLTVTAYSETYPEREVQEACELAGKLALRHLLIRTEELSDENFAANPLDRCYYCKTELFKKLHAIALENGLNSVLDGSNYDDISDYRPGMRAAKELGVVSPLKEAGLTKGEIRELSREMGLPTWNKPSFACLSSRFPYGRRITPEKLRMVGLAEDYLRQLGIRQIRVRHHEDTARIEVRNEDFPAVVAAAAKIASRLKELGYVYVTLDLQGYRTGSMNEVLEQGQRETGRG